MKPFRLKLQALLTLRQREEQTSLDKYAQTLLARERALQNLSSVEKQLSETWTLLRSALAAGSSASALAHAQTYCRALNQLKDRCQTALALAQRAVNQALQEMITARKNRETVDKYHKNQRRLYDREFQREEQKLLDDLSTRRLAPALDWRSVSDVP